MENLAASTTPSLLAGGSLFSKFLALDNPDVSKFISSIPTNFRVALHSVASAESIPASDRILRNRAALAKLASKFHSEAGTLTSAVQREIGILRDPATKILAATHQPNLFAYGGVFKKIVLLEALKNSVGADAPDQKVVTTFFVIDHDFLDEVWMRVAQFPSLQSSSGCMEARFPLSESQRWKMVCRVPVPSHAIMCRWKSEIKSWVRANSKPGEERKRLIGNLEDVWLEYEDVYSKARSYADLNSFFISRIANKKWDYSVLFLRLSECSQMFGEGFTFLLANYRKYADALEYAENLCGSHGINTGVSSFSHIYAPLWLHCPCGSKSPAKISTDRTVMTLEGSCISCTKELRLPLGDPDNFDVRRFVDRLSPKAIPILLLLARDIGITSYVSGIGGLGYLVDTLFIAKNLGIRFPMVIVWSSRDDYVGIGQRAAVRCCEVLAKPIAARIEELHRANGKIAFAIRPLLDERSRRVQGGKHFDALLPKIFSLKEAQRKVRAELSRLVKACNAATLSPCFLDYAINFGISQTESFWSSHLVQRGALTESVVMTMTPAAPA